MQISIHKFPRKLLCHITNYSFFSVTLCLNFNQLYTPVLAPAHPLQVGAFRITWGVYQAISTDRHLWLGKFHVQISPFKQCIICILSSIKQCKIYICLIPSSVHPLYVSPKRLQIPESLKLISGEVKYIVQHNSEVESYKSGVN